MLQKLNAGILPHFSQESSTFEHRGTFYQLLCKNACDFANVPYASIGESPTSREIITLNPKNSPFLDHLYTKFKKELAKRAHLPLKEKWKFILYYVKYELFSFVDESLCNAFVRQWIEAHSIENFTETSNHFFLPVIPLEDFIKAKVGLCRHLTLTTAYLIDRLLKEASPLLPKGNIFYIREKIAIGENWVGHAWNLFVDQESGLSWHLDPTLQNMDKY